MKGKIKTILPLNELLIKFMFDKTNDHKTQFTLLNRQKCLFDLKKMIIYSFLKRWYQTELLNCVEQSQYNH